MAVEKMKMLNVMGRLEDVDRVLVDILRTEAVDIIPARSSLDANAFTFSLEDEDNLERNIELNYIGTFERDEKSEELYERAKKLKEFFGFKDLDLKDYDLIDVDSDHEGFYREVSDKMELLNSIEKDLKVLESIEGNYELFQNVNIDLGQLNDLKYFKARFGVLDKDGRFRLKKNYGNILAIVYHTATIEKNEVYLAIYPTEVENEIDRILKSLNWQDVDILGKYEGSPKEILNSLKTEEQKLRQKREELIKYRDNYVREDEQKLKSKLVSMILRQKLDELKKYMMRSKHYFYLSGWVGASDVERIKSTLSKYKDIRVDIDDPKDSSKPPTKLKNPNFFKPFELLINMYGVPNYRELDPTIFLSITYMILFGAMFGDLGQGAVFFIAGIILHRAKGVEMGALIERLGISSMVFGILYGSVFGREDIIKAYWMRPFENIDSTLKIAIAFGIVLIVISFVLGFINKLRLHEYEELYFGNEGIPGFVAFLCMVNLFAAFSSGRYFLPKNLTIALFIISLGLMVFKKPLYSKISKKHSPYESGIASYYIEGTFLLLETVMSLLSNIISFIRVGAFAINHVGLFLAFETLGKMMGNSAGNIFMLILGNIIIITLEGLIVFIQSLRLEYYEMFSKYNSADGYQFVEDKISLEEM